MTCPLLPLPITATEKSLLSFHSTTCILHGQCVITNVLSANCHSAVYPNETVWRGATKFASDCTDKHLLRRRKILKMTKRLRGAREGKQGEKTLFVMLFTDYTVRNRAFTVTVCEWTPSPADNSPKSAQKLFMTWKKDREKEREERKNNIAEI